MSGAIAIRQLLVETSAVTEVVPPNEKISRIVAGMIAREAAFPALAIRVTGSNERMTLRPGPMRHLTDRVQVVALTHTSDELMPLIKLVSSACAHKFPAVDGLTRVVVLPAAIGDDATDEETSIHMKTHDFTVSYSEPR
jgi:hypothetical protein